jgi:hypothetical protein
MYYSKQNTVYFSDAKLHSLQPEPTLLRDVIFLRACLLLKGGGENNTIFKIIGKACFLRNDPYFGNCVGRLNAIVHGDWFRYSFSDRNLAVKWIREKKYMRDSVDSCEILCGPVIWKLLQRSITTTSHFPDYMVGKACLLREIIQLIPTRFIRGRITSEISHQLSKIVHGEMYTCIAAKTILHRVFDIVLIIHKEVIREVEYAFW